MQVVERETFESALQAGRAALETLGVDRYGRASSPTPSGGTTSPALDATLPYYQDEASRMTHRPRPGARSWRSNSPRDRERFEREHGGSGWK